VANWTCCGGRSSPAKSQILHQFFAKQNKNTEKDLSSSPFLCWLCVAKIFIKNVKCVISIAIIRPKFKENLLNLYTWCKYFSGHNRRVFLNYFLTYLVSKILLNLHVNHQHFGFNTKHWWSNVWVLNGSLSSLWPASFGLFAYLDFGPCPLPPFLSLSWVLSHFIYFGRVFSFFCKYLVNVTLSWFIHKPMFLIVVDPHTIVLLIAIVVNIQLIVLVV
jgi:hypothetical protein